MTTYTGIHDFRHDQDDCTGVLVVNLGTTAEPTPAAVRRYLAEFLWDPRVIEIARPLWWLILHGVILRFRPAKVARAYQSIWTEQGSPLLAISERLSNALQQRLGELVPIDDVITRVEGEYAVVKSTLQAIPVRVSVELADITDAEEIEKRIKREINAALTELSNDD